jgi:hypothetical protein
MMPDKNIVSSLNDLLVNLSQSINIDYLALVSEDGEARAAAGNPGDLSQADVDQLLKTHFTKPGNFMISGSVDEIRIIKQGMVECFVVPINRTVQLLAVASHERPSVLIRTMLSELLNAREGITAIVEKEWKETQINEQTEPKKAVTIKETAATSEDSLESLITKTTKGTKEKDASKYWDNATLEDQDLTKDGKTISFDEARRSGLVPDDKK